MLNRENKKRLATVAVIAGLAAMLAAAPALRAATVSMTVDDAVGTTSFNAAGHWDNLAAPSAGNNYFNATFLVRTPGTAGDYTFAGDSLTITGSGLATAVGNQALSFKTAGISTITINNLTVNGGQLRHAQGDADVFNLAGTLAIGVNGATMGVQGPLNINSSVSGSGTIRILDAGNDTVTRAVTFTSGANTYNGSIELFAARSRFNLANAANLSFTIGASGVNNSIFGIGVANLDGAFNFDLSGAGNTIGNNWTIVNNATVTETFGATFSVAGFTDLGGDLWGTSANGADYLFSEATGGLSVVPEPGSVSFLLVGAGLLLGFHRLRRSA